MPILANYNAFDGRHYETGTIHNALAYQGIQAPHTGNPYSEALLMGVSGGAAFGYFTFHYTGYDPQLNLITRNTFDPMETLFDRLAIPREVLQTSSTQKGEENLIDVLEDGQPAIVWANLVGLPYNGLSFAEDEYYVLPILVYGHEDGTVYIADRSKQPFTATADQLATARSRVKKDKHRIMTLAAPDESKLAAAVNKGIWQSIALYTEAPPKGARHNFGFEAYKHWAKMLTNTRNKNSWERYFPAGRSLYSALLWGYMWVIDWGAGEGFERHLYADFLEEAAVILSNDDLQGVADQFRESAAAWCEFGRAMLPDSVPLLKETRHLMTQRREIFIEQGDTDERIAAKQRLDEIKETIRENFPMTEAEVMDFKAGLAEHVMTIHDIEHRAIEDLQAAMS